MTMTAMWRCDHRLRLQSIRGSCSVGCCYLGLACVLVTVAAPSRQPSPDHGYIAAPRL
jgi:hypothetical protein